MIRHKHKHKDTHTQNSIFDSILDTSSPQPRPGHSGLASVTEFFHTQILLSTTYLTLKILYESATYQKKKVPRDLVSLFCLVSSRLVNFLCILFVAENL